MTYKPSPNAAADLLKMINDASEITFGDAAFEECGNTDCPEGCIVEPDGRCPHGYESAALTAELI